MSFIINSFRFKAPATLPTSWYPPAPGENFQLARSINYGEISDTAVNVSMPSGYVGGVLLPDGRVYCCPYVATTARIFDPVTNTFSTPSGTFITQKQWGGVLLGDGRVYMPPANEGTAAKIYNPTTNTLIDAGGVIPSAVTYMAILMHDGRVFCAGSSVNDSYIYDPVLNTNINVGKVIPAKQAMTLLPDGRVFCLNQFITQTSSIYNPVDNSVVTVPMSGWGTDSFQDRFRACTLLPDGRVFCMQNNGTRASIILDPNTLGITPVNPAGVSSSMIGCALMPNGKIYCMPGIGTLAIIYDPATNTSSVSAATFAGGTASFGGIPIVMKDGRIFMAPNGATYAKIYGSALATPLPDYRVLSAYDNKTV